MSHPAGYFATFIFDTLQENVRNKKLGAKNKWEHFLNWEMSHSLSKCRTEKPKCDVGSQGSKIRIFPVPHCSYFNVS
jgi:hypothetical protein